MKKRSIFFLFLLIAAVLLQMPLWANSIFCFRCGSGGTSWYRFYSFRGSACFCPSCNQSAVCFSCLMPLGSRQLPDGRWICDYCFDHALQDSKLQMNLFNSVKKLLKREFGMEFDHPVLLRTVDAKELSQYQVNNGSFGVEVGVYMYEATMIDKGKGEPDRYEFTNEKCSILVLDTLPAERLVEIYAHELTHDFLLHKYRGLADQVWVEGVCEYVSASMNVLLKKPEKNVRFIYNPDPVYGNGFRQVRDYVEQHSWAGLLKFLDTLPRKRPPETKD